MSITEIIETNALVTDEYRDKFESKALSYNKKLIRNKGSIMAAIAFVVLEVLVKFVLHPDPESDLLKPMGEDGAIYFHEKILPVILLVCIIISVIYHIVTIPLCKKELDKLKAEYNQMFKEICLGFIFDSQDLTEEEKFSHQYGGLVNGVKVFFDVTEDSTKVYVDNHLNLEKSITVKFNNEEFSLDEKDDCYEIKGYRFLSGVNNFFDAYDDIDKVSEKAVDETFVMKKVLEKLGLVSIEI